MMQKPEAEGKRNAKSVWEIIRMKKILNLGILVCIYIGEFVVLVLVGSATALQLYRKKRRRTASVVHRYMF